MSWSASLGSLLVPSRISSLVSQLGYRNSASQAIFWYKITLSTTEILSLYAVLDRMRTKTTDKPPPGPPPLLLPAFFLGGGPELCSESLIHSSQDRQRLRTEASGNVHLRVGVLLRNFEKFGVEVG